MKKTLPTSSKARSATGWHKHLRRKGKRAANKGTRKVLKLRRIISDTIPADEWGYHLGDNSCKTPSP